MAQDFDPELLKTLTAKQREVLSALYELDSLSAVAHSLGMKQKTVDNHLSAAKARMGLPGISSHRAARIYHERSSGKDSGWQEQCEPAPAPQIVGKWRPLTLRAMLLAMVLLFNLADVGWERPPDLPPTFSAPTARKMTLADLDRALGRLSAFLTKNEEDPTFTKSLIVLVDELMNRAWTEMWGPEEDTVLGVINRNSAMVRLGIQQALESDPDVAVEMLGSGHRLLKRLPAAFFDWRSLVNVAEAKALNRRSVAFARFSLGVAYGCWEREPRRGYEAAERALKIFRCFPGTERDQANAMRHMGVCMMREGIPGLTKAQALALYDRAMEIYDRFPDKRGIAQTILSYAQQGNPSKSPDRQAKNLRLACQALDEFCQIGNLNGAHDAFKEINQDTDSDSLKGRMAESVKSELGVVHRYAEFAKSVGDRQYASEAYRFCMAVGHVWAPSESMLADTEMLLALGDENTNRSVAAHCLVGLYLAECRALNRLPVRLEFDPCRQSDRDCEFGARSDPSKLVDFASNFQRQFEPSPTGQ